MDSDKNNSDFTITINDSNNTNIGIIQANSVGEYVSSSIGWIDYSVNAIGLITGDIKITGCLSVGSLIPANTSPGDISAKRLILGPNQTLTGDSQLYISSTSTATTSINQQSSFIYTASPETTSTASYRTLSVSVVSTLTNNKTVGQFNAMRVAASHSGSASLGSSGAGSLIAIQAFNQISGSLFLATIDETRVIDILPITASGSNSTGTITLAKGIHIQNSALGSGPITVNTLIGIDFAVFNAATTTNVCFRAPAPTSGTNRAVIQLSDNNGTSAGGIAWGNFEFSLYRSAVNTLTNSADHLSRHYLCSSVPTVAAGAAAGTSPTIAITGTDHGFTVTLTTGTTATTNATLFTVTFGSTWTSSAPAVTWNAGNSATATLSGVAGKNPFVSTITTTTMTFTSNTTALSDSTTYIFRFTAMR